MEVSSYGAATASRNGSKTIMQQHEGVKGRTEGEFPCVSPVDDGKTDIKISLDLFSQVKIKTA